VRLYHVTRLIFKIYDDSRHFSKKILDPQGEVLVVVPEIEKTPSRQYQEIHLPPVSGRRGSAKLLGNNVARDDYRPQMAYSLS